MIRLTDDKRKVGGVALGAIWIGNYGDSQADYLSQIHIGGVLNVAQDMVSMHNWSHGLDCMQVGLVDGPGNELGTYCAAVLALHALLKRYNVLVCCHGAGRSLAVAVMYISASSQSGWWKTISMLQERVDVELPTINPIHMMAFDNMEPLWPSLKKIIGN